MSQPSHCTRSVGAWPFPPQICVLGDQGFDGCAEIVLGRLEIGLNRRGILHVHQTCPVGIERHPKPSNKLEIFFQCLQRLTQKDTDKRAHAQPSKDHRRNGFASLQAKDGSQNKEP